MNEDIEKIAKDVIDNAYVLIEEDDFLVTITERGLIKSISKAILQAKKETYEECAKLCDVASKPKVILSKDFHTTTMITCTCGFNLASEIRKKMEVLK